MSEKPAWLKSAADVLKEQVAPTSDGVQAANENMLPRRSLYPFLSEAIAGGDALEKIGALEDIIKDVEQKKPELLPEGVYTELDEYAEAAIGTWTLEEMGNYLRHADVWANPRFTEALIAYARVRIEDVRKVYS